MSVVDVAGGFKSCIFNAVRFALVEKNRLGVRRIREGFPKARFSGFVDFFYCTGLAPSETFTQYIH